MAYTQAQLAWLRLASVRGMGTQRFNALLERFGSPTAVWETPPEETAFLGRALNANLQAARADEYMEALLRSMEKCGAVAIMREDREYPALLREIPDAPPVLYVRGCAMLDDARLIGVVGARSCSAYGSRMARRLGRELAEMGVTVVSGFARGIDSFAHRGAIDVRGRTVAVFGSGVDVVYPPENLTLADELLETGGSIISANPPGTSPRASVFPARNRIISGMSEGTVVVEASQHSGSLLTADFALAQGRTLFAVPGQADSALSAGTNKLIRAGARLTTSARDVAADLGWHRPEIAIPAAQGAAKILPMTIDEQRLYNLLEAGPMDTDGLVEASGMPVDRVNSLLTMLEIQGIIKQTPGRMFERADEIELS
ncbi:MAG: DNA-processing protein DprA [Candidatus Aphodomonas sp.]|nr:DNA-processing protein DprA [Candidatus Aphodomonas sp.]